MTGITQEWREEGIEIGVVKGKVEDLSLLLTRRFGTLSDAVSQKIEKADIESLKHWFDKAIDASSLDAVFNDKKN